MSYCGVRWLSRFLMSFSLLVTPACQRGNSDAASRAFHRGDYETAVRLWQHAATLGRADAQCKLGRIYLNGLGVRQDFTEARKWFELAASQGSPCAFSPLGYIYRSGKGVPPDYVEAMKWYNLASAVGDSREMRETLAWQMTKDDLATAEHLAAEWRIRHSIRGRSQR